MGCNVSFLRGNQDSETIVISTANLNSGSVKTKRRGLRYGFSSFDLVNECEAGNADDCNSILRST